MHDTTEEKVLEVSEEQLTRAERSEQKFTKPEPTPYFLTLLYSMQFGYQLAECGQSFFDQSSNEFTKSESLCRLGHDSGAGALFANIWN